MIRLPEEIRQLQKEWFSKDIPEEVQERLRFASSVGGEKGARKAWDNKSGGAGTIISRSLSEEAFQMIKELQKKQLFPGVYDEEAENSLRRFLQDRNVELELQDDFSFYDFGGRSQGKIPKRLLTLTEEIYKLLPEHHLGHQHFEELKIGGWGGGAAKCSEYKSPKVHMFEFAVKGPIRNYVGLLLHETGHAYWEWLKEEEIEMANQLEDCNEELHNGETFGIDYLHGPESRIWYCQSFPPEFAAEFYLTYVSQGERFQNFLKSVPKKEAEVWQKVYDIYKETFNNKEFY